jgi:hypothetical protein
MVIPSTGIHIKRIALRFFRKMNVAAEKNEQQEWAIIGLLT